MRKHFYLLAVLTCGWISMLTTVGTGHPQGGQAPAPPTAPAQQPTAPAAGQRGFVPGTESGFATFQTRCSACHGNPAQRNAPIARCDSGHVA